jgi:NAD(P)-dependent dehydrogenase (short-subunit alcohol dehydrogenase family)
MKTLKGSVAVVTGAGSGIGRALAQELALQGAQLALADINGGTLEETRGLLGAAKAKIYTLDVADAAAVEDFARKVEQDFGRASVLINNAGVALYGNFAELTLQEFDWLFRINFWGVVHGCKSFLPLLKREPEAHIVNISSVFGLIAPAGQTAYSSSKFAVRGFTQALKGELDGTWVSMTCVHPGGIRTNIAANARAGANTRPEGWEERQERFRKAAHTSPEKAAQIIVRGILRNKARVLIGADAYLFEILQRLFPVRCSPMIASWFNRQVGPPAQEPAGMKEKEGSA